MAIRREDHLRSGKNLRNKDQYRDGDNLRGCQLWVTIIKRDRVMSFLPLFWSKNSTWAPYKQAKRVLQKVFAKNGSLRSRWLCGHHVGVVVDMTKTMRTLSVNFEGFSQILKEQSGEKRYLGVFTHPICNNILKIWKPHYLNKKLCVCVVVDSADTRFSNLAIEYVHMGSRSNL